jgi:hypothetical protein
MKIGDSDRTVVLSETDLKRLDRMADRSQLPIESILSRAIDAIEVVLVGKGSSIGEGEGPEPEPEPDVENSRAMKALREIRANWRLKPGEADRWIQEIEEDRRDGWGR